MTTWTYDPIAVSAESTVVAEHPLPTASETAYQSEADLERELIGLLTSQAYEYLPVTSEAGLIANLRLQLEKLNQIAFSDAEWQRFFTERIAGANDGIVEKTVRVQEDPVQLLKRHDGSTKNVQLIDKQDIHNNRLQVINQYVIGDGGAAHANRYDVTVLVNGLPMVHVELKRRGVDIREAFNQIDRYQRDSFWAGSGLFGYVQHRGRQDGHRRLVGLPIKVGDPLTVTGTVKAHTEWNGIRQTVLVRPKNVEASASTPVPATVGPHPAVWERVESRHPDGTAAARNNQVRTPTRGPAVSR